ncbi:MAG: cobaltochelatase CobT [Gammaproteobacteria bacterium]|jgi:cobaltochelatase CobT
MRFNHQQQQHVEELCGASIRALTGLPGLHHRGRTLFLNGKKVNTNAPHLQTDVLEQDFRSHRGIADGIALRLKYSNEQLHQSFCPPSPIARLIFDMLEQLRVESQVTDQHPGIKQNLLYRFQQWSLKFHYADQTETQLGLLIFTIAQASWSRLTGLPTLEEIDDVIESTRANLSPLIGSDLVGLRKNRHNQSAYAAHALSIAKLIDESLQVGDKERALNLAEQEDTEKALNRIALSSDFSDEAEDANIASIITGTSKILSDNPTGYRVFTEAYDQEYKAASKIRDVEIIEFRDQLDGMIKAQGINIPRLARQISDLLAQPGRDGWQFGEEEGVIDGRRLSQVISSPSERRIFRKDRYRFKNDCLVSFLIDCSGSMKQYIESIAMMVDIFGRALDQADISSEILGFTTGKWNGGRALKDWIAQGRPENPGRLAERSHLIFKNADTGWRKSRRDIAALLKSPYFREGVDGEAVNWACQRMRNHGEERKILIVISDGSPMDAATHQANDEYYLDHHLKQTVERNEAESNVEIYGLGVGLSLTPYYRHSLAIDLSESLSNTVFQQILHMIAHAKR